VYEERENLRFGTVENYFPISYDHETFSSPGDTINQNRHRTRQVEQGFTKARRSGVAAAPRGDVLKVLESAIINQEWYIHIQPTLDAHAALIRTPEFKAAAGDIAWNWWRDQIDIVARKGWSAKASHIPWLRDMRINLNQAVLGFKLSTILMQPFAVFDAAAYATSRWGAGAGKDIFAETLKAWLQLSKTKKYISATPELKLRQAGEVAVEETLGKLQGVSGAKARAVRAGFKALQFADVITAAGVEKGLYKVLKKHGVAHPKQEAAFLMNLVSGSAGTTIRPHVLASGEIAKTVFTFQTFFLNRWGIISHDLIRAATKKGWRRRAMVAAGAAALVAGGMVEEEARQAIYQATTGKTYKTDDDFIKAILLYVPRQLPIVGNLFEGQSAEPPVIRTAGRAATGVVQIVEGKPLAGGLKLLEGMATLLLGIPGTAQGFDFFDAMLAEPLEEEAKQAKKRTK